MRIVIFAGGSGRRLWPISRQSSPKQFEPIVGEVSTLQLAARRVAPVYGYNNIYVATNARYRGLIHQQLPELPVSNIIFEPARRDLGPAVGLAMAHLGRSNEHDPVAILWSDNFIENEAAFIELLGSQRLWSVKVRRKYYSSARPLAFQMKTWGGSVWARHSAKWAMCHIMGLNR